jgi:putative FmdB family regulatory protein
MAEAESYQSVARIGDERRSCIADQSNFRALFQRKNEFGRAGQLVVLVIADQRFVNVVVREQLQRMAGILAGDLVYLLEDANGAKGDVLEIANGRPNQIEAPGRTARILQGCARAHADESSTRSEGARAACYTLSFEQLIGGVSVPLYEYKCLKCGRNTEKIESVSGPHLKKCPHCGGRVESVITAPAIQFKGAGWYVTDYGGKESSGGDSEKTDKAAAETKEAASKEKDSSSKDKDSAKKEAPSKESKEKKPAAKK